MKHETLKRQHPPRKRVQLSIPEESITDQTLVHELSMASIKQKLEKNLPIHNLSSNPFYSLQPLQYTNLQDALNFQDQVRKNFEELPSGLRKEMGNDIRNFESFVNDPRNNETLLKYGLASQRDATNSEIVDTLKELKETFGNPNSVLNTEATTRKQKPV